MYLGRRLLMNQEDIKNLVGWLQAIYKESQTTRATVNEMRRNVDLIPAIRTSTDRGTQDSGDAEKKIEDTRHSLEARINKLEDILSDLRTDIRDIRGKLDRIK